jgi:HlyD family secretion protein
MRNPVILDLADGTEYRQALQARPPRVVHGTVLLLAALLGSALLGGALTEADLVVLGAGRVRPEAAPTRVFTAGRQESSAASFGGRVVAVSFRVGDEVRRGDVLLRLDTAQLDNEIARRRRTVEGGEEELRELDALEGLTARQYEAARAKAAAELAHAEEEVRQAKARQDADVRLAEAELDAAQDEVARLRKLTASRAAAPAEMAQLLAKARQAREKLRQARVPVEEGKVEVLRRTLALAARDHGVRCQEHGIRRAQKEAEVGAVRTELANLELERRQAVVRSPLDGVVTTGEVKVGDVVERGKPVAEVAGRRGFLFEATVPSEEVGHLRVGMAARLKLDAYDYQKYGTLPGTVSFISPDSGVHEGQRAAHYVVRIALESAEVGRAGLRGQVKLGMAGQVEVVTRRDSLLAILIKRIRHTVRLG